MAFELRTLPILWTLALVTGAIAIALLVAAYTMEMLRRRRDRSVGTTLERGEARLPPRRWALHILLGGLLGHLTYFMLSQRKSRPVAAPTLWALGYATAVIAVVLLLAAWTREEIRNRGHAPISAALEHDLGFRLGTPYVKVNGMKEVIMIMQVEPGSRMDEAGGKADDVVTGYTDTRDLFDDLEESRGASFAIPIVRDGESMQLVVSVPP